MPAERQSDISDAYFGFSTLQKVSIFCRLTLKQKQTVSSGLNAINAPYLLKESPNPTGYIPRDMPHRPGTGVLEFSGGLFIKTFKSVTLPHIERLKKHMMIIEGYVHHRRHLDKRWLDNVVEDGS